MEVYSNLSNTWEKKANFCTDIKMEDDELPTKTESLPEVEEPSGTTADVTSAGGRRRGRRKVMRKVQNRDDEGYLGTSPDEFLNFHLGVGANTLCSHEH